MKFSIDKPHMVYAEFIESGAIDQFKNVMAQPWVLRGALMPDAHRGYTLPIGGVVETDGVVSPVFVGMDIGCGVCAQPTSFNYDEVFDLRYRIRQALKIAIPLGFNHHKKSKTWHEYAKIPKTDWFNTLFNDRGGLKQIGTLGGGNHFIEIGADENKKVWIIIHSGSRGIGADTAKHYIRMAHPEGKVKDGAYGLDVNSQEGKDYIMDMNICLDFALENRVQMIDRIMYIMGRFCEGTKDAWIINRTHNHAESKDGRYWIHRKGATHAEEGMLGVVPGNWRDGSFIVKGKGNPESLYSSSHGAGRILGRKAAKRTLDLGEQRSFIGDIAAEVDGSSIDEAPGAYKDIFEVMRQQTELVDIGAHVRPIINVKG
jgi:tRNA-splicing ligase RtcB